MPLRNWFRAFVAPTAVGSTRRARPQLSIFEDRLTPAVNATLNAGGVLSVTLDAAGDLASVGIAEGQIVVRGATPTPVFTFPVAAVHAARVTDLGTHAGQTLHWEGSAPFNFSGVGGRSLTVTGIEQVTFTRGVNAHGAIAVTGATEIDLSALNTVLAADGQASVTLKATNTIQITDGAGISVVDGKAVVQANTNGTALGGIPGVAVLAGGTVTSLGRGSIALSGRGGSEALHDGNFGVTLEGAGTLVASAGTGPINVNGTGGAGRRLNYGVQVTLGAEIRSAAGLLRVSGRGGASTQDSSIGIVVQDGGLIAGTGMAPIALNGTGGIGTDNCVGILVAGDGLGTAVRGASGTVELAGRGAGRGSNSDGIEVALEAQISTTTGTLFLDGRAGTNVVAGDGVEVSGIVTKVATSAGPISLHGIAAPGGGTGVLVADQAVVEAGGNAGVVLDGTSATGHAAQVLAGARITAGGADPALALGLNSASVIKVVLPAPNAPSAGLALIVVEGGVNLGLANLTGSASAAIPVGGAVLLIDNDGNADPTAGFFATGSVVTLRADSFAVSTTAGDGNDVVLTKLAPSDRGGSGHGRQH